MDGNAGRGYLDDPGIWSALEGHSALSSLAGPEGPLWLTLEGYFERTLNDAFDDLEGLFWVVLSGHYGYLGSATFCCPGCPRWVAGMSH